MRMFATGLVWLLLLTVAVDADSQSQASPPDRKDLATCGTPNPSLQHTQEVEQKRRERLAQIRGHKPTRDKFRATAYTLRPAHTVPVNVYVHIIKNAAGAGDFTNAAIQTEIDYLNVRFAPSPYYFELKGIDRTVNDAWYTLSGSPEEDDMKRALRVGDITTLNIYTLNCPSYCGWAYYPWGMDGTYLYLDGVIVNIGCLRRSIVHETGHWLGLYHTFQNGCGTEGDYVADTPDEASAASACDDTRDTCPTLLGLDPVHNFMDYTTTACRDHFTAGQYLRMDESGLVYRGLTVQCPTPLYPNWNFSACTTYVNGVDCSVRCNTGYIGAPTAVCQETGEWAFNGTCDPATVQCPSPSYPNWNFSACTPYESGVDCPVRCNAGYVGAPMAVCQEGQWAYNGTCDPVPSPGTTGHANLLSRRTALAEVSVAWIAAGQFTVSFTAVAGYTLSQTDFFIGMAGVSAPTSMTQFKITATAVNKRVKSFTFGLADYGLNLQCTGQQEFRYSARALVLQTGSTSPVTVWPQATAYTLVTYTASCAAGVQCLVYNWDTPSACSSTVCGGTQSMTIVPPAPLSTIPCEPTTQTIACSAPCPPPSACYGQTLPLAMQSGGSQVGTVKAMWDGQGTLAFTFTTTGGTMAEAGVYAGTTKPATPPTTFSKVTRPKKATATISISLASSTTFGLTCTSTSSTAPRSIYIATYVKTSASQTVYAWTGAEAQFTASIQCNCVAGGADAITIAAHEVTSIAAAPTPTEAAGLSPALLGTIGAIVGGLAIVAVFAGLAACHLRRAARSADVDMFVDVDVDAEAAMPPPGAVAPACTPFPHPPGGDRGLP